MPTIRHETFAPYFPPVYCEKPIRATLYRRDYKRNPARWVRMFFFLFSILVSGMANAGESGPGPLMIDADRQFQFATDYLETGQYLKAVAEFERFVYFFPDDDRVDLAHYRIGLACHSAGLYKHAIEPFSKVIDRDRDKNLATRAYFRLSETFVKLDDHHSALELLDHAAESTGVPEFRDEARYRAGWIYLGMDRVGEARDSFKKIGPENRERFRMDELERQLSRDPLYPTKSPGLAGFLSIVPGAGFAYCGRYRDALAAFFLNAGLIVAAFESFDNGNEALGAVIAFVGAGFYGGNIYGAVSSAHKYNRSSHQRFLEDLHSRTSVTLSLVPEHRGVAVGLRYRF